MNSSQLEKLPASFRDPSGYIFLSHGKIFRSVAFSYKENYDKLISSGLYECLAREGFLISHIEDEELQKLNPNNYKIIQPQEVPFISYPYEWSFSQLQDAALLTLKILKTSIEYGMILKDATAFNVQFYNGKPIFIDTLSFQQYTEGEPWVAYRQFCMNFLSPLLLMKFSDLRLNKLMSIFLDGIPLDLTRALLPKRLFLKPSNFSHIYLHSLSEKSNIIKSTNRRVKISKSGLLALVENLENSVRNLKLKSKKSFWRDYYSENSYSEEELVKKKETVKQYLEIINPGSLLDLGSNTGLFSRLASENGILTISSDFDPHCVELNYIESKQKKEKNILPLYIDIINPSPSIGWNNKERGSFLLRKKTDVIMALALIHHVAITNNVPLLELAYFFSQLSNFLIIEFVPKEDIQVKSLLANREDIFENYNSEFFEEVFGKYFDILQKSVITDSGRTIYLLKIR